ncbi:hypothetical protein CIG75_17010 [Tumebacillus algifaecis]|uniref:DUF4376 domain-containing protein n=1 Tax=Tumebacillus algifaecis TaxID=1214604 RepID=A0A223D4Q6_9BACL|nr:DUF4376 domain-containing protein [Tumebacillus algifaecis]ASS76490.1 hypothetical protein CIG75_17010 [Tumebacillus algifaecis]
MQIGRKIYYDKATGNVLVDTGERSGDVVETTIEQDFSSYVALAERVPATVGVLELPFGEFAENFARYPYRVQPLSRTIVFDVDATGLNLDQLKAAKIAQLNDFCNQAIIGGFVSTALGEEHQYGFDREDQANLTGRLAGIAAGTAPTEFLWKTKDAGPLTHTVDQFKQVCLDGDAHKEAQIAKFWTLKATVEVAQTIEELPSIEWN